MRPAPRPRMMWRTSVLGVVAGAALLLPTVLGSGWVSEVSGHVTFARSSGRAIEVFTLALPEGDLTRHTHGIGTSTSPAWTSDGVSLVIARRDGIPYNLYRLDPVTDRLQRLTAGTAIDGHPSPGPDGERLAFASNRGDDGSFSIYEFVLPDARATTLPTPHRVTSGRSPAWSPADDQIAFERDGDIWLHDLDDGIDRRLTSGAPVDATPAWSPDARRLVFSRTRDGERQLFVLELETGVIHSLIRSPGNDFSPAWSPNERWVVFSRAVDGGSDLWIAEVSTGRSARLTDHARSDVAPTWRPSSGR